jgi:uncharacterized protein DUF2071
VVPLMNLRLDAVVERRLLLNYRADPDVVAQLLPPPFRPQLRGDYAVVGICLLRLGRARPAGLPAVIGLGSENATHRIAVSWGAADNPRTAVYIPRRDSGSRLNVAVGDRLFPGVHHRAVFDVAERPDRLRVAYATNDGSTAVEFEGLQQVSSQWRVDPCVVDRAASSFFDDRSVFPAGSIAVDSALVMRKVAVRWTAPVPLAV